MSGAVATAVASGVASAAVGAIAQSILAPDVNNSKATPPTPTKPPQASQAPDVQGVRQNVSGVGQAGGAPGVGSTFLTGSQGVDPSQLLLGKATLLGG